MAENAAHFSFTSEAKPSIFEVVAQKSLNDILHPALHRILQFLSSSQFKFFGLMNEHYDESFLFFNAVLQYYYMKKHDATFSEYFYGLKRIQCAGNHTLSREVKAFSLIATVLLPYLSKKIEEKLTLYKLQAVDGHLNEKNLTNKMKQITAHVYTIFRFVWRSLTLLNYLTYMSDKADSQLPGLRVLGLKLVCSGEQEDIVNYWSSLLIGKLSMKEACKGLVQNGVRTSLEIGAFFIQFLQAWYNDTSSYNVMSLPTVPPPPTDRRGKEFDGRCPICLQLWKIPTALPVSGYVFCFPCIVRHLQLYKKCPITNNPAKPTDVVRLYDSS